MTPSFAADLARRAETRGPIMVGVVGAGQMGTDLLVQIARMPGLRVGAVAVRSRVENAFEAALMAGHERGIMAEASSANGVDRAIEAGRIAVTTDLDALAGAGRIEVIIDATGHPDTGAVVALAAIRHGKHIVMLNVESDITVGRLLKREADRAGIIYPGPRATSRRPRSSSCASPARSASPWWRPARARNNPLNFDAVPAGLRGRGGGAQHEPAHAGGVRRRLQDHGRDGGARQRHGPRPRPPGMHGPRATRDELAEVLVPQSHGGVLSGVGRVDYTIGRGVAPGVFAIVGADHPRVVERMTDLHVGKGPFFTLHRPYHLTSLECPLTAARAVLHGTADMQPLDHPVAETGALAKRDLAPGTVLGRIGETDYRGWSMVWAEARAARALPIGLAERARVTRPIRKGEMLSHDNCAVDESLTITRLRRQLDTEDRRFLPADAA